MLNDICNIEIKGANFESSTQLPLLCQENTPVKITLLYGRNGAGKSTIARGFRIVKGLVADNIESASVTDIQGSAVILTDEEKTRIHVFDEDFINENVRIQEQGLGSIVMLGEQAGLSELIETAISELHAAENDRNQKKKAYDEYNDSSSPKSPRFYIIKMYSALQQDDGWAGRKRIIDQLRRNASVSNNTYKNFLNLSPAKSRDALIIEFNQELNHLMDAQTGASKITVSLPCVSGSYKSFRIDDGNELLKQIIEHPELSPREQYLLNLVQTGHGEALKATVADFLLPEITVCPKCHQPLSQEYKDNLIKSIQKVLSERVKEHQKQLSLLILPELDISLDAFKSLSMYQNCIDQINTVNQAIQKNNALLQSKINDPYTPIGEELLSIAEVISALEECLTRLEEERKKHNRAVADTVSIKTRLNKINDEIAYWDIIDFSQQHDLFQAEKEKAEKEFAAAQEICIEKQNQINELNAKRNSIDIAIDLINDGLKYIFFSESRMQIRIEDGIYKLICNNHPVKPKDVSVGERNIIGLCYFFTSILKDKSRDTAYSEESLIIIDDPVSSYDLENRVGILSFLKYELGCFLLGNIDTRALVMTHDLFTAFDVGKMSEELIKDCNRKFNGQRNFIYAPKELQSNQIIRFINNRNEYSILLDLVYKYAIGDAVESEPVIGNIIRQTFEAFSTFEFKKKMEEVSVDDDILAMMEHDEYRLYFKNLMYRLVLNKGSHRFDQTRNMQVDFFSFISEEDKRRTAKDILCFMNILNPSHIKAHLGIDAVNMINTWCDSIVK